MNYSFFSIFLLIFAIIAAKLSIIIVRQGFIGIKETFGRFNGALTPGIHIIMPLISRITRYVNIKEQVMDITSQEVITRDNAMVLSNGVVFYQVLDAPKAIYEVSDLELAITNLAMTNIRTVLGSMVLDELLSNRDKINSLLLKVMDEATAPWGIKITRVEIKDIEPPSDLVESMGRQMKAERDKRALILEAEGKRQSEILQSEGEKQGAILKAEGTRTAAFLEAEARERSAEAEAKATDVLSKSIKEGNIQAINYFVANNYVEALKQISTSPNTKLIFAPLEVSSIVGSLGGISEIVRDVFSDKKKNNSVPNK